MKFSAAFVLTLLTGALAAPQVGVVSDSEKRDIAARDAQDSGALAVDVRHVDAAVTLNEREVTGDDFDEEDGLEARQAKGKGKGKGKAEGPAVNEVGGHEVYMAGDDDTNEDAAVYKSSDDDENILFFQAAAWNKLTIVLRDSGALKFVKYVSRKAKGDRWDISGVFEVEEQDGDSDADDDENGEGAAPALGESEEEEFNGFSDSEDSDSD